MAEAPTRYGESVHQTGATGGTPIPATTLDPVVASLQQHDQAYREAKQQLTTIDQQIADINRQIADLQGAAAATREGETQEQAAARGYYANQQLEALAKDRNALYATRDRTLAAVQKAAADRNNAYAEAAAKADPDYRQTIQSAAAKAKTDAEQAAAQFEEWKGAADDRKAAVAISQRSANLRNAQDALNLQYQQETDPLRKQQLQQQIEAGNNTLKQAQVDLDVAQQTAGARVTTVKETATQAGIQTQTQQATLDDLLRRIRQAPSDEQAREALETALAQGKAGLEATKAGTEATRAGIQQAQQGTLYGLDEYIAQQKEAIAKGLISTQEADRALQARIGGTTPFAATQAAEGAQMNRAQFGLEQRGQDVGLAGQRLGNLTSMANTGLGQFAQLNNTVEPGSDAAGRGLLGWLTGAEQMVNRVGAAPPQVQPPPLPPMLQSFAGGQQPGPVSQPAPTGAGSVTINIGGGQPTVNQTPPPAPASSPAPGFGGGPYQGAPNPNALGAGTGVAMLDRMKPATPQDVLRVYGRGGPQVA